MNFERYQEKIKIEISSLSHEEKVALCLMCCNRLSPLYDSFFSIEKWGDPSLLAIIRESAKNWLNGLNVEFNSLKSKIEDAIPDTEEFGTIHGSYALNSSVAHAYLLDLISQNNTEFLGYVLQYCYDTLDFHVQEILDPKCKGSVPEEQIENHQLMIDEIDWQFDSIEKVKGNKNLLELVKEIENKSIIVNA